MAKNKEKLRKAIEAIDDLVWALEENFKAMPDATDGQHPYFAMIDACIARMDSKLDEVRELAYK